MWVTVKLTRDEFTSIRYWLRQHGYNPKLTNDERTEIRILANRIAAELDAQETRGPDTIRSA